MRQAIYIIFCMLLFVGCKKPEAVSNLNNNTIAIIGHGGNGIPGLNSNLPMDSYESAVQALDGNAADGVELDIKLSADSVLFMYHDQELDGLSSCSGCIFDYQSEVLLQCKFKPVTSADGGNYYLSALEKVVAKYSTVANKPIIFIDLHADLGCGLAGAGKEWYYSATLYAINSLLAKYNAYDYIFVQANSFDWLMEARNKFPNIKVFLDVAVGPGNIAEAANNGFYGVACKDEHLTEEEVTLAHSKGLRVQLYGVRGKFTNAINKSPDYILTDNIPLLRNTLKY